MNILIASLAPAENADDKKADDKVRSAVGEKKTVDEKAGTMFLCSADLFLGHSKTHSPETFRGIISGCAPEFKELVKWLVVAKKNDDVLVVADGRSDVARDGLGALVEANT